ncbi:MAG: 4-hydroxy-tetrahydrodipicolinate reductase [Halobacteriaceae archaeon]
MKLAVTGATGRMGREVIAAAHERGDEVAVAINRDPTDETVEGVDVKPAADLEALLSKRDVNALVDFTGPASSLEYVDACAATDTTAVVGTTGFDESDEAALREYATEIPLLRAANFARGVQALQQAVAEAVEALPGYDVELTETHHNAKRDAPSGTAKELLATVESHRDSGEQVHGREGEAPRTETEIGVHARRAGDVTGEHEILLADNHEVLTLTHRAESRGVFAAGALDAAAWLAGRDHGYYTFADVVGDT